MQNFFVLDMDPDAGGEQGIGLTSFTGNNKKCINIAMFSAMHSKINKLKF